MADRKALLKAARAIDKRRPGSYYKDNVQRRVAEATKEQSKVNDMPYYSLETRQAAAKGPFGKRLQLGTKHLKRIEQMGQEVMPIVVHQCPLNYHAWDDVPSDEFLRSSGQVMMLANSKKNGEYTEFCAPVGQGRGTDLTARKLNLEDEDTDAKLLEDMAYELQMMLPGAEAQKKRQQIKNYMDTAEEAKTNRAKIKSAREAAEEKADLATLSAINERHHLKDFNAGQFLEQCKRTLEVQRDTTKYGKDGSEGVVQVEMSGKRFFMPKQLADQMEKAEDITAKIAKGELDSDTEYPKTQMLVKFYDDYMKRLERKDPEKASGRFKIVSDDGTAGAQKVYVVEPKFTIPSKMSNKGTVDGAMTLAQRMGRRRADDPSNKNTTYDPRSKSTVRSSRLNRRSPKTAAKEFSERFVPKKGKKGQKKRR